MKNISSAGFRIEKAFNGNLQIIAKMALQIIISMKASNTYRISLVEGDFFNQGKENVQQFYQALFQSFSLLSWINDASQIKILDEEEMLINSQICKLYTFSIDNSSTAKYLVQFDKIESESIIKYCLQDHFNRNDFINSLQDLKADIKVTFLKQLEQSKLNRQIKQGKQGSKAGRTTIFIDIEDQGKVFEKLGVKQLEGNIELRKSKLKQNELQYFYKEPVSRRSKQIPNCHFNIALQGGGAKGISYVGVFKALKQLHPSIPITSIIGSSAGGILALAISTEMKPQALSELCFTMDTIPNNKYFNSETEIKPSDQKQFDEIIHKIKCTLHNNGILQHTIFDQLIQSLNDIETSEKILTALEHINPSVAQLFSLQLQKPVSKGGCLFEKKTFTRRFNYYGFLKAGMIRGDSVEMIAARSLIDYFSKHFKPTYTKDRPLLLARKERIKKILKKWGIHSEMNDTDLEILLESPDFLPKVKALTLREYYQINEVEITSTSVDLDDQVLRFFNHKTTPDLPVCKSIQLTGTFPIAFMPQTWKKEWGKYYIHYSNTRKQIDLTGHTFTDGGLLANFPIKYLDNEEMRPMYFSHKKNPATTILYGFGLDQLQSKVKDEQLEQNKKKAFDELKDHILSKISKLSLMKNLIFSDSSAQLDVAKIEEIPLLNYITKLINTFSIADYNLNIQCFKENIILTEIDPRAIQSKKEVKKEVQKFRIFKDSIDAMETISSAKKKCTFAQVVAQACTKIRDALNQFQTPVNDLLQQMRYKLLSSMYNYQGTRIKEKMSQAPEIRDFIRRIQYVYPNETFKMQSKASAKDKLLALLGQIQKYCDSMSGVDKSQADFVFQRLIDSQLCIISKTKSRIEEIIRDLQAHPSEFMENDLFNKLTSIDYQLIYNFAGNESKFFITDQMVIQENFQHIKGLNLPALKIQNEMILLTPHIQSQLKNILRNSKHNKIHIVLESKENSHLYFGGQFQILQNLLHRPENLNKKIDMITTSDMQSVFAFLLASGKKLVNIRSEMWKVNDLICFEEGIEEEYNQFSWTKTESQQMHELLELAWADHYGIFQQMQQYLMKEGNHELAQQVKTVRSEFLYSKNQVTTKMENILDYVTKSSLEALKIKDDPKLQKKRLAQYLSLKNGQNGKDYSAKNQMISKNTQRFIKMMMIHFEQLIIDLILDNHVIKDTFELVDDAEVAEKVWKGALIRRLLSSKRLELYIKGKLEEMKLNQNTTLSQFYDFCPRKITLNFSLINKKKERMELINRFTSPNFPIWAAIIASTSMPLIMPEFSFLEEWQVSSFTDGRMRKLIYYFFSSPEDALKETYISGNFVSTLPLELLTNQKLALENYVDPQVKEQLYTQNNKFSQAATGTDSTFTNTIRKETTEYTLITFAFSKREAALPKQALHVKQRKKKFFDFSNVLNLGLDYLLGRFKNLEVGLKDIGRRLELLKLLSIRIQCHDNTIMNLYYDQTIKLPIELGTLDFYKIANGRTEMLHHCIYQSQFVVRGIFENLCISQNRDAFYYEAKKQTYLQYQSFQGKIYLKFISKTKWNRKLATNYKVYWRLEQSQNYLPYDEDQIIFPDSHDQIYLKFDFPDTVNLRRKSHELLLNFTKLKGLDEAVFFKFNYERLDKKYLLPVKLFSQRLRTRVIPKSSLIISQSKIEESLARLYIEPSKDKTHIQVKPKEQKKVMVCNEGRKLQINQTQQNEENIKRGKQYLYVKTVVNLKNDGLYCNGCVKPLSRAESKTESLYLTSHNDSHQCAKCNEKGVIIGYQCNSKSCTQKESSKYCFPCLFVYLLYIEDGVCRCTVANHELQYVSMKQSKDIVLCHFCQSGAISYYRDRSCDINLCYKCSLILETKKLSN